MVTCRQIVLWLFLGSSLLLPRLPAQVTACDTSAPEISLELRQASADRNLLPATARITSPAASYPEALDVFEALIRVVKTTAPKLPPYRWNLSLVDTEEANAFSFPDGEILVARSLAPLLGHDRGLWAALLSHEIIHVMDRHWLKKRCLQNEAAATNLTLPRMQEMISSMGREVTSPLAGSLVRPEQVAQFSREQELEADGQGLMLMARAGFHPDYFFALNHLLKVALDSDARFSFYTSTHPEWDKRDRAGAKLYGEAMAEFRRATVEDASSSGTAIAPAVAFLGHPQEHGREARVSVQCRNVGAPVELVLIGWNKNYAVGEKRPVRTLATQKLDCTSSSEIGVSPAWQSEWSRQGKIDAEFVVLGADHKILDRTKTFALKSAK